MKRYKKYVKYVNLFVTKIYNKGINYELCYVYNYIIKIEINWIYIKIDNYGISNLKKVIFWKYYEWYNII